MAVLGLSLLAAFSLSLAGFETVAHLRAESWKLPALLILLLLVPPILHRRSLGSELTRIHWVAGGWIVAAVMLQGFSAAVGWSTGYRLALGLGAFGLLRMTHLVDLPHGLLLAMAVPPPTILAAWNDPALSVTLAHLSTSWMADGTFLPGLASTFPLPLQPSDGGLMALWVGSAALLSFVLSESGRSLGFGEIWKQAAWLAPVGLAIVVLSQLIALAAAAWLAESLGTGFARVFLNLFPACAIFMAGHRLAETSAARTRRRAAPANGQPEAHTIEP